MSQNNRQEKVFIGHAIRAPRVLCINADSTNLGVISTSDAIKLATDQGLDLVQVSPPSNGKPPTCKILNYGKFKYDQSKKEKEAAKKQRESIVKTKEIKLHPTTDINDLKIKAKKAAEFLDEGSKVKVMVLFRGWREASHKAVAVNTLNEFLSYVTNGNSTSPSMDGKVLSCMLERNAEDRS